jgi:hypothetical protein
LARKVTANAAIRHHPTTDIGSPDGYSAGTVATTTDLTNYRSGRTSWLCSGDATNTCFPSFPFTSGGLGVDEMGRTFLFNLTGLPTTAAKVARFVTSAGGDLVSVRLTSAGKFQLWNDVAGTQIGSDSTLVVDIANTYCVRLRVRIGTGAVDQAEMRVKVDDYQAVDEVISGSSLTISDTLPARFGAGWVTAPGAAMTMNVADVAVNDSTGTKENSLPLSNGKVVLSTVRQVAGATATAWLACTGSNVDIPEALNNTPPIGLADHTDATHASNPHQASGSSTDVLELGCASYMRSGAPGYIDTARTSAATSAGLVGNQAARQMVAQGFYVSGQIDYVEVRLWRGAGSPTDDQIVELQTDSGGFPSGVVLSSGTINAASITATSGGAYYRFPVTISTVIDGMLWVVVRRAGPIDAANYVAWMGTLGNVFYDGTSAIYGNGVWSYASTLDLFMRVALTVGNPKIKVISPCCSHAEAVATGTKTTNFQAAATDDGTLGAATAITYGDDLAIAGTWPTGWPWKIAAPIYDPSVANFGAGPRLKFTNTFSGTRTGLLAFAGAYIEYIPPAPLALTAETWQRYQKTADSSFWWAKQATSDATYECGTDGQTIVNVSAGDWFLYPEPQVAAGGNYPATATTITDDTLQAGYIPA